MIVVAARCARPHRHGASPTFTKTLAHLDRGEAPSPSWPPGTSRLRESRKRLRNMDGTRSVTGSSREDRPPPVAAPAPSQVDRRPGTKRSPGREKRPRERRGALLLERPGNPGKSRIKGMGSGPARAAMARRDPLPATLAGLPGLGTAPGARPGSRPRIAEVEGDGSGTPARISIGSRLPADEGAVPPRLGHESCLAPRAVLASGEGA